MGKVRFATAAQCRKCSAVCKRLSKRYADNRRVNIRDRNGGLTADVLIARRLGGRAEIASVDWFGFGRRDGSVAEVAAQVAVEIDSILARIAALPVLQVRFATDGKGNSTEYPHASIWDSAPAASPAAPADCRRRDSVIGSRRRRSDGNLGRNAPATLETE